MSELAPPVLVRLCAAAFQQYGLEKKFNREAQSRVLISALMTQKQISVIQYIDSCMSGPRLFVDLTFWGIVAEQQTASQGESLGHNYNSTSIFGWCVYQRVDPFSKNRTEHSLLVALISQNQCLSKEEQSTRQRYFVAGSTVDVCACLTWCW